MLDVLANRTYRHLFLAQVIALVGTGLLTVAMALLAYQLAGADAGIVLGTALAIKMIAYVGVAPVAAAFAEQLPRRPMLIALDLVRAAIALLLPFVTAVWQIYVLVFLLQSASAAFTPTFQATIPDVLPDERSYTRALSLSRLAYDMESLASPILAAVLLSVMNFHNLFAGTVVGFLISSALIYSVALPTAPSTSRRSIYERTTRGVRIYLATPRLRGLLAVTFAAAAASAMVIVNTVVLVQTSYAMSQSAMAIALACFGAGSMATALALPGILEKVADRPVMLVGAGIMCAALLVGSATTQYWQLLPLWGVLGIGYSLALTPSGRLLRRSSDAESRPALFAAQFALSHVCWLVTYPLAGWAGTVVGLPSTFALLGILAVGSSLMAARLWPASDPVDVAHDHDDLAADDPHLADHGNSSGRRHSHAFVIDGKHPVWPRAG